MAIVPDQGAGGNFLATHPFFAQHPAGAGGSPAAPWMGMMAALLRAQNPQAAAQIAMNRGLQQAPQMPMPVAPGAPFQAVSGAVPTALAPPVMQPRPEFAKQPMPPVMPPLNPPAPVMHPDVARQFAALAARPSMPAGPMPTAASGGFGMPGEQRNPFAMPTSARTY